MEDHGAVRLADGDDGVVVGQGLLAVLHAVFILGALSLAWAHVWNLVNKIQNVLNILAIQTRSIGHTSVGAEATCSPFSHSL